MYKRSSQERPRTWGNSELAFTTFNYLAHPSACPRASGDHFPIWPQSLLLSFRTAILVFLPITSLSCRRGHALGSVWRPLFADKSFTYLLKKKIQDKTKQKRTHKNQQNNKTNTRIVGRLGSRMASRGPRNPTHAHLYGCAPHNGGRGSLFGMRRWRARRKPPRTDQQPAGTLRLRVYCA